jgi:hypothetical protein
MSSEVVYNSATCLKTIKGKEHYAICVMCPRRVNRKCYGDRLSNSRWTLIRQTFTCSACKAEVNEEEPVPVLASRGQHLIATTIVTINGSQWKTRSIGQHTFHQQLLNTKL